MTRNSVNRRTALKTIGVGIAGGVGLTGSVTGDHLDQDGEIRLVATRSGHDFDPDTYHTDADSVTWRHDDPTPGGIVHNVRIHEHENQTKQLNSPRLGLGDTYTVNFSLSGDTLTLSDARRSISVDVTGQSTQEFGVHCDYHLGQTDLQGSMKMEEFLVNV